MEYTQPDNTTNSEREIAKLKKRLWLNQGHWDIEKISLEAARMEIGALMIKVTQLEIMYCRLRDKLCTELDALQKSHPKYSEESLFSERLLRDFEMDFDELKWQDIKFKEQLKEFRETRFAEHEKRRRVNKPNISNQNQ